MKTTHITIAVAMAAALIAGCTGSSQLVGARQYAPVPNSHVQILYFEPKRPYEVISFVHAIHGVENPAGEIDTLRDKASRLGADAVIVTSAHHMSLWEYAKADGIAIKWK